MFSIWAANVPAAYNKYKPHKSTRKTYYFHKKTNIQQVSKLQMGYVSKVHPQSFFIQNSEHYFFHKCNGIGLNCGQESIHSSAVCETLIKLTLLIVVVSDDVKAISLFLCRDNRCLINMQSSSSAIVVS